MPEHDESRVADASLTLDEAVRAFLQLTMLEPEKPPKTQRAQRENRMLIIGFNRAQETLRSILEQHGADDATKVLAEVREEGQQRPMDGPGGIKMWVAS
jgi:hypothetical protein